MENIYNPTAEMRDMDFKNKFLADDTLPEIGIGITNRAALAINGKEFRVVAVPHSERSSDVHILTKTPSGLSDEKLPVSRHYSPLEL